MISSHRPPHWAPPSRLYPLQRMHDSGGPWWSTCRKYRNTSYWSALKVTMSVKPNDAQHTQTAPEPNTGINVTLKGKTQNNTVRINLCLHTRLATGPEMLPQVTAHLPLFPSVTDTFPDYFLDFWITDFTVTGGFHPLQNKPPSINTSQLTVFKLHNRGSN